MHPTESLFIPAAVISLGTVLVNITEYGTTAGKTGEWLNRTMVVMFWLVRNDLDTNTCKTSADSVSSRPVLCLGCNRKLRNLRYHVVDSCLYYSSGTLDIDDTMSCRMLTPDFDDTPLELPSLSLTDRRASC